jgi:hypothetical protein
MSRAQHLSDEQVIRAADHELLPAEAASVQSHLRGCESCRERVSAMAAAMADFTQAYRESSGVGARPDAFLRARLKARLAEERDSRRETGWLGISGLGWAAAAIALLLVAIGARIGKEWTYGRSEAGSFRTYANPLIPDTRLTPGAVLSLSASQICRGNGPPENRPPSSLQKAVFHEYGMDGAAPDQYEVDHLITPALGGSDDIRNLWPESYSSEWNAHVKDELEDYLHDQVCSGKMDLPTAQREISTNWISAYEKYFHTDRPLRRNSQAVSVRDDDSGG